LRLWRIWILKNDDSRGKEERRVVIVWRANGEKFRMAKGVLFKIESEVTFSPEILIRGGGRRKIRGSRESKY